MTPKKQHLPDGWTGVRGLYKHARGTVESGHPRGTFQARLTSGEREYFKLREDAFVWVEGGGVWPKGYVRQERKP